MAGIKLIIHNDWIVTTIANGDEKSIDPTHFTDSDNFFIVPECFEVDLGDAITLNNNNPQILEKPIPSETQEVQLIKNEQGMWEYILVDKPLTEVDVLKKELAEQKALIDAILGVDE